MHLHYSWEKIMAPNGVSCRVLDASRVDFRRADKADFIIGGSKAKVFSVLPRIIERPTCIKDARGPGIHQFLFHGSTLVLNEDKSVTGIEPDEFDNRWQLMRRPEIIHETFSGNYYKDELVPVMGTGMVDHFKVAVAAQDVPIRIAQGAVLEPTLPRRVRMAIAGLAKS